MNLNGIRHPEVYAGLLDTVLAELPPERNPNLPLSGTNPFDNDNRYLPYMNDNTPASATMTINGPGGPNTVGFRDRWFELSDAKVTASFRLMIPCRAGQTAFWVPGTPAASLFQPFDTHACSLWEQGMGIMPWIAPSSEPLLRMYLMAINNTNRNWLETGTANYHQDPDSVSATANGMQRHHLLSKILNNTTTTSNCFIVYATVGY
ncbi:MAG: hypothetical protein R3C20_03165 [Planctomycetaceae bacterium]